jgi:hypothetical protein
MENRHFAPEPSSTEDLMQELSSTRTALANAYEKFNFVSDPEMVDSCIYEINSLKAKYNYLFRKLKEQEPEPEIPCLAAGVMEGGSVCQS